MTWIPRFLGRPAVAALFPLLLPAQEQPLSVVGTFSTGYYTTTTTVQTAQSLTFVPFGAKFDINGYVVSPDLFNFLVQPELNAGPQASEAGFEGGNGVRLRATFFRKIIPITVHYANVQVEDVYFGSLTQVSGYTLKDRNKDLGVTMEFRRKLWPEAVLDWGTDGVDSTPGIAGIPDYISDGHHVNLDAKYEHSQWVFEGFFHYQYARSDLLAPGNTGAGYGSLRQIVQQYQGTARRGFWKDSEFFADGGSQTTSSQLFAIPIDLTTRYGSANLRLMQRRRWRTSLRAAYSSNLASQLLAQAAASLTAVGSAAPSAAILAPFSYGISNYLFSGTTNYDLGRGFGLFGNIERSALISDNTTSALSASYLTSAAGVTYSRRYHWGSLSGEYEREYGVGSITGQSGTIQGQSYRASFEAGNRDTLEWELMVHGDNQNIHNAQPMTEGSVAAEGSVSRRVVGDFSAQLGGGWQWSTIVNTANQFHTGGYTARIGFQHPLFQLTASLNSTNSNSLAFYSQFFTGLGPESLVVTPQQVIPSDYRAMLFSLHTNPLRKVELSAQWSRSLQHLDGFLNNDFSLLNVYLTYHFRRLQLEAGYIRAIQTFSIYPLTLRERFYVRVSRTVKLL